MKILTIDLAFKNQVIEDESLDKIASYLETNDLDICFLQDCYQKISSFKIDNYIRVHNVASYIASKIGYQVTFFPVKMIDDLYEVGLAIISKEKVMNPKIKVISKLDNLDPSKRAALISGTYENLTLYNTKLLKEDLMYQIHNILEVTNKKEKLIMLAGNFQAYENEEAIVEMKKHLFSLSENNNLCGYSNIYLFTNIYLPLKRYEVIYEDFNNNLSPRGILIEF